MNKSFWLYSAVIIFSLSKICAGQIIDLTHKKEVSVNFVFVKGGTFEMGDLWGMGFSTDEKPVHVVHVKSFWISDCEITNEMFADFLNEAGNPVELASHLEEFDVENALFRGRISNWVYLHFDDADLAKRIEEIEENYTDKKKLGVFRLRYTLNPGLPLIINGQSVSSVGDLVELLRVAASRGEALV